MEAIFNQTVELEREEIESSSNRTRGVHIKMDHSGRLWSVRNIRFGLADCLDGIFNIACTVGKKEYLIFASAIFLYKFIKRMGIDLKERQTVIIVTLYQESKHNAVTDENLEEVMGQGLRQSGYRFMDIDEIYSELKKLKNLGIIEIQEGKYQIAQKIYFE